MITRSVWKNDDGFGLVIRTHQTSNMYIGLWPTLGTRYTCSLPSYVQQSFSPAVSLWFGCGLLKRKIRVQNVWKFSLLVECRLWRCRGCLQATNLRGKSSNTNGLFNPRDCRDPVLCVLFSGDALWALVFESTVK